MAVQMQVRRGTAAAWTAANPTLLAGEIGYETDSGKFKVGDGATAWAGLGYSNPGPTGPTGPSGIVYGIPQDGEDGEMGWQGPQTAMFTNLQSDLYTTDWTNYGPSSTVVGWSGTPSPLVIAYKRIGKLVYVNFRIFGTSNATNVTFTLPYTSENTMGVPFDFSLGYTLDNGVSVPNGTGSLPNNSATVTCYTQNVGAWTGSGAKRVGGQFWYQTA